MELNRLTATELIHKMRAGAICAVDICEDCLAAVSAAEPVVKAWEHINPALIMEGARRVDAKKNRGLLSGIPVGVKDIFNTKDMPTGMGSPLWEGFEPGNDARVVDAVRLQDGLIFGKTVTAEFAVHYLPRHKTVNPHDPRRSPGTSSSGSAAAVASCMVPLALGTQTAGSTIRPASYCGIVGFKPTFGTLPRTAMLKTTDTLDTIGLFSRSIDDARLFFDVMRVKGADYPFVNATLDRSCAGRLPRKAVVGYIDDGIHVFDQFDAYAREAFGAHIERMKREKGISLVKIKPPSDLNRIHAVHATIYDKTLSYYFKEEFKNHTLISELMYEIVERGNRISAAAYAEALEEQARIRSRVAESLAPYDAVLTLSTSGEAPLIEEKEKPDTCLIWTFLGCPALNVPLFKGPHGLPFGLQVVSKRYDDYTLLAIAKHFFEIKIKDGARPYEPVPH